MNSGVCLLKLPLSGLARFTLQAEQEMKANKDLNRITYLAANISVCTSRILVLKKVFF